MKLLKKLKLWQIIVFIILVLAIPISLHLANIMNAPLLIQYNDFAGFIWGGIDRHYVADPIFGTQTLIPKSVLKKRDKVPYSKNEDK